ncbi:hypothetical protein GCM10023314_27350 [Algibacter agarivorans]|uniref:Uncharacterized protein n=1 Tax=Algibacter agarivorans TaxID=1109741 RepID=A0ABP9GSR1_9FLAO
MNKTIHYIFIVASIILLYNIVQILSLGLSRLSEFGYGALIGKVILFSISVFIVYKTRTNKPKLSK